jgi:Transposase, Mutator family
MSGHPGSHPSRRKAAHRSKGQPKQDQRAVWREGLGRLTEEGRLLWLLGEGLSALLDAEAAGTIVDAESIFATVSGWARHALAERPTPLTSGGARNSRGERPGPTQGTTGVTDTLLEGKQLTSVWCPVLWVGSREWRQSGLVTVVLGVGVDGRRRVLALRRGSVREQGAATELLSDLRSRGLNVDTGVLVVTDGSRLVDEALRTAWGASVLVSHCRHTLLDEVASHLVEDQGAAVRAQMAEAWTLSPSQAAATLEQLAKNWQRTAPGAADRLRRSIGASLAVDSLGAVSPLKDRLVSMGSVNQAMARAHAWGDHGGELADLLTGLNRWLSRTRRLMGWQQLGLLAHGLQEAIRTRPLSAENEDCTPQTNSGAAKGKR